MIWAVVSDTHGVIGPVTAQLRDRHLDGLLFAGDYYADGPRIAGKLRIPCYAVAGNCDGFPLKEKSEALLELAGKKVYLLHGHQYGVKRGLNRLYYRASEIGADLVVFGHTHEAFSQQMGNVLFFNPGSPVYPYRSEMGSFGLLEFAEEKIVPALVKMKA